MVKKNQEEQAGQREAKAEAASSNDAPPPRRRVVAVPNVLHMDAVKAVAALQDASLQAEVIKSCGDQPGDAGRPWEVKCQIPAARQVVFASSTVALSDVPMVVVPYVIGELVYDALSIIQGKGLQATMVDTNGDEVGSPPDDWYVNDQDPKGGALVSLSTNIALIISSGMNP